MAAKFLTSKVSYDEVNEAASGDARRLEAVVKAVLHDAYGLALRFLWHPQDAEDATQEIAFRTWVYRIACNTLSSLAKKRIETAGLSFDTMSDDLDAGLEESLEADTLSPFEAALVEEVKVGCTHAMLICLDRDHRFAYILGTILDIDHVEAADVLGILPAAFRKRLSRANARISKFMTGHCGIANSHNACRCEGKVAKSIACGRVDPHELKFSRRPVGHADLAHAVGVVRQLEAARRAAEIYRSHPDFDFSTENLGWVVELLSPIGPLAGAAGCDPSRSN
jgi:DNA-directed RNA polymerase specialized sigma24 family protein